MSVCEHCKRENCSPAYFILCIDCEGAGCETCKDSIVPGVQPVDGDPVVSAIVVCSAWGDPEVDAAIDNQRPSLIEALKSARDRVMDDDDEF